MSLPSCSRVTPPEPLVGFSSATRRARVGIALAFGALAIAISSSACVDSACLDSCPETDATSVAASTSISTSVSAATGTSSGTSGSGGGLSRWVAPSCSTVMGTSAVTYSPDGGVTTAPNEAAPLTGIAYTFGLVTLPDAPGYVLADHAGELLLSRDAGCHFESLGPTGLTAAALAAAPSGVAYGWVDNADGLFRVDTLAPDGPTLTLLTAPSAHLVGLGVDPSRPLEIRVMNGAGQMFVSHDRGDHFEPIGQPCPASGTILYRAAFDPGDLDHVVCGVAIDGAWITKNGGADWILAQGLGEKANGFSTVVSPVDGSVVWLEGITLLPTEARHVFRSEDGGETFAPVVDESNGVTLTNGAPLWAHPTSSDRLLFEFGTDFQGYGTDIYVYDHTQASVAIHHHSFDQVAALAFSPASPDILYFGISSEKIQQ